jgi:hypothetical protein
MRMPFNAGVEIGIEVHPARALPSEVRHHEEAATDCVVVKVRINRARPAAQNGSIAPIRVSSPSVRRARFCRNFSWLAWRGTRPNPRIQAALKRPKLIGSQQADKNRLPAVVYVRAGPEIAFDEGEITAGERRESVSEIELELKAGEAGSLYDLALSLIEVVPLRVGTLSKAERGYALAFDLRPRIAKAAPSEIRKEDRIDEVIAKLVRAGQRHLVANEAAAEDAVDPEGVHQSVSPCAACGRPCRYCAGKCRRIRCRDLPVRQSGWRAALALRAAGTCSSR